MPELPATEYTVCLAVPGATSAMIVVQNDYPTRYPNDLGMSQGEAVLVRVVGSSGRVMRRLAAAAAAPLLSGGAPTVQCFPANGPMPDLLSGPPVHAAAPAYTGSARSWTVHTFGY